MACWRQAQHQLRDTTWWCWPPVLKNAVSHDGAARTPGSRHQRICVKHVITLVATPNDPLSKCLPPFSVIWIKPFLASSMISVICNWFLISVICYLLSATEAWLNQHLSERALNISRVCVCVCVCVCIWCVCVCVCVCIWDLPRLRIELLSLALADRYLTTEPPGKNKITLS